MKVYTFLSMFPPQQSIIGRVCDPDTHLEEAFPPTAPFKILYSNFALRECLVHQSNDVSTPKIRTFDPWRLMLRKRATTQAFTQHSIRALTATITNLNIDQAAVSFDLEASVVTALIECLLAFIRGS